MFVGCDGAEASTTFVHEGTIVAVCFGADFVGIWEGLSTCVGTGRIGDTRVDQKVPQFGCFCGSPFSQFFAKCT